MELNVSLNEKEYFLFKNYIAENCGIVIPAEKSYMIETRLSKFLLDTGTNSFDELYDYLIKNNDPVLNQKIINSITTNETKWFRDETPWKVLEKIVLPRLIDDLASGRKTKARIWSAAASTGQEIYSTVMCVDNYLYTNSIKGVSLKDFDFLATDISSHVIHKAKNGRYDKISIMRGLNDYYKMKYFTKNGFAWDIDHRIRDEVKFTHFNLLNSYEIFGSFDIIFCRYLLIYFSDILKKEVAAKMYNSLLDNGVLFTGNYVIHDLFSNNFKSNNHGNLTYYIKKEK
ncbi:MAG: protein-glutamate O-methyltransferase CheR [Treponema sp.]|nr:protein-glutamate O-methyltransferase CheR [Treponema sp.]